MKTRYRTFLWLALLGTAILSAQEAQESGTKEKEKAVVMESFLRMDLLRAEKKPLPPPRRNIFTGRKTAAEEEDVEFSGKSEPTEEKMPAPPVEPNIQELDLRYLGYVRSGERMVALIIFQGEALAVAEGEQIEEGVTVSKILPDEIEVTGPDSEPSIFFLEGELP
jgi:hypothetical protein